MLTGKELPSLSFLLRCYLTAAYGSINGNSSGNYTQDV